MLNNIIGTLSIESFSNGIYIKIFSNQSFNLIFLARRFLLKLGKLAGSSGLALNKWTVGTYLFELIVDLVSPLGLFYSSSDCSIITIFVALDLTCG